MSAADDQVTFAATLVDEWVRGGVRHAVVSPGSRSTPLAWALLRDGRIDVHVHHDERSGAFMALGVGAATGIPALMVTTSGTAAVECHPAVVEADLAAVPLLVCTADRPRRLWDVAAPQAVDQTRLFGGSVRWFVEPGVPDGRHADPVWRSLAARALLAAGGSPPGPVHLNLEFDEPLLGAVQDLPPGRAGEWEPWHRRARSAHVPELPPDQRLLAIERGVIIAGGAPLADPSSVHALADAAGWPVLADPRSGARSADRSTIAAFDGILRVDDFAAAHRPDVILQLGPPPASRVLAEWLATAAAGGAEHVVVDAAGRHLDPGQSASGILADDPSEVCARLAATLESPRSGSAWALAWQRAEAAAQGAIDAVLREQAEVTEPAVARALLSAVDDDEIVVVSSSMPVRDVEWYSRPLRRVRVLSNRGANGIDGVVSTAVGAALGSRVPVTVLVGDVAMLHDTNALLGLNERPADVRIVVVDNDGGGIFSFLPQATALDAADFERLFGTPHGVDLSALAAVHGIAAQVADDVDQAVTWARKPGPSMTVVRTERASNVEVHVAVHAAIAVALGQEGLAGSG